MKTMDIGTPEAEFASLEEPPRKPGRVKSAVKRSVEFAVTRHLMRKVAILGGIGGLVAVGYMKRKFLLDSARRLHARF
jgi:hypothetical protein